jgi:hypothetical protein
VNQCLFEPGHVMTRSMNEYYLNKNRSRDYIGSALSFEPMSRVVAEWEVISFANMHTLSLADGLPSIFPISYKRGFRVKSTQAVLISRKSSTPR